MKRTNLSVRETNLDDPLLERPGLGARRGDRFFFNLMRGYLGLTAAGYLCLGLITLAALIINPAAGAVALVLALVVVLVYKA